MSLTTEIAGPASCPDSVWPAPARNVLFVGAERPDEFADAARAARRGHSVLVVNPRKTSAARAFERRGGLFAQMRVERLPVGCCRFDVICENYPYPAGPHYVPARPFALARLTRLALGGRWVLHTESHRLVTALRALAQFDADVRRTFALQFSRVTRRGAPASTYLPVGSRRFRLIFERHR